MAGFSPTVAADVLSRSLFFWQYQQKQEASPFDAGCNHPSTDTLHSPTRSWHIKRCS